MVYKDGMLRFKHQQFNSCRRIYFEMFTSVLQIVALSGLFVALSLPTEGKTILKRGVPDFGLSSFGGGFNGVSDISFSFQGQNPWAGPQPLPVFVKNGPSIGSGITIQKTLTPYTPPISPSEIASALAAAREANSRVQYLQSRVQAAKDQLVEQQHLARAKEQAATLALQQSEAAAAVQRQAASAAAASVVHAQQRLAEAKGEVADQQRVAAAKEQIAAHVIQKSASAAAAEIQRTEDTAAKIAALQRSEAQAAIQHVTATKDASLSATASAVAANNNVHGNGNGNGGNGGNGGHSFQGPSPKFHPWN